VVSVNKVMQSVALISFSFGLRYGAESPELEIRLEDREIVF
jgi:hypothetical protein